jgi:hypothetical protein
MLCTMGPSTLSTRAPYLGSEIHGPGTQVDSGRTFKSTTVATIPWVWNPWPSYTSSLRSHPQARSGGNCTLGLKSTAQVLKPTLVAQVDANGRIQAYSVAQADFGRNLKPAMAAKLLIFSDFSFVLAFRKVLFVFCILGPPRVAQSRLL